MEQKRVLIIDDDREVLEWLSSVLTSLGYSFKTVVNEEELRAAIITFNPDILLIDIKMPKIDGIRLCHNLKCSPETSKLPVVIFTGYNDNETFHDAILFGASDFLAKPFEAEEVRKVLEACLERAAHKRGAIE